MRLARTIVGLAAALVAGVASAQTPTGEASDEVVVTALRPKAISDFVRAFAEPTKEGKLSRWDGAICPGTLGLQRKYAEYVNERVAQVARQSGLKVRAAGCRPDVLIVLTADPAAVTTALKTEFQRELGLLAESDERLSTPGRAAFQRFLGSDAPVRWWHVSRTISADGVEMNGKTMRVFSPSRLKATTQEVFDSVLILVDVRQTTGFTYASLADYLAVVSLAQIDPEARYAGVDTVLNLFNGGPKAMTAFDRDYLLGLYGGRADAIDAGSQRRAIVSRIRQRDRD